MTQIVSNLLEEYKRLMDNGDHRLKDWPLMKGPLSTITICLSYVIFVKYIGPQLMKERKPFNIRNTMIIYNVLMMFASAYIVYVFAKYAWFSNYSFRCQPVDYSSEPIPLLILQTSYFYFILKFFEFIDTIFFILRKKFSHVSTLHVIHHGIMPFSVWWGLKFVPGGHATFFGFINSFVHVIMYMYYALAAFGPRMSKYLWWKKYLTTIQMIQFILIFTHSIQLLFYNDCNFPKIFGVWIGLHGVLFWFLFARFYKKTYLNKKNDQYSTKSSNSNSLLSSSMSSPSSSATASNKRNSQTLSYLMKLVSLCSINVGKLVDDVVEQQNANDSNNTTLVNDNIHVNGHIYHQQTNGHTPRIEDKKEN